MEDERSSRTDDDGGMELVKSQYAMEEERSGCADGDRGWTRGVLWRTGCSHAINSDKGVASRRQR